MIGLKIKTSTNTTQHIRWVDENEENSGESPAIQIISLGKIDGGGKNTTTLNEYLLEDGYKNLDMNKVQDVINSLKNIDFDL